jgi:2-polyprenyl-3-methyl-5-hydroxy-6-metoxy-1,4-benzoquinol methylase
MHKVIIFFGVMGAGKTRYAAKYSEGKECEFIPFDTVFSNMLGGKFEHFYNYVITKIKSTTKTVIIDGWFAWDEEKIKSHEMLKKENDIEVEWIYIFAETKKLYDRYMAKPEDKKDSLDPNYLFRLSCERIRPELVEKCKFIYSGDNFNFIESNAKDYNFMVKNETTEKDVIKFTEEIGCQEPYQNISLPFGYCTNGYRDCEKSWEQIKPLVDWKGKNVMEIGTFWGYFAFVTENEGADVIAIDVNKTAIETAEKIKKMKDSNVSFFCSDIENENMITLKSGEKYDVILFMNILHHLRTPFNVLKKVFENCNTAILEIELVHDTSLNDKVVVEMGEPIRLSNGKMGGHFRFSKEMIMRFAAENGHFLKKEVESFRPNRTILLFERDSCRSCEFYGK